jgi:hypothetical protein
VRAASATTNVRLRLGVSGDIASSTAAALTSSWVKHTATWTPTASVDVAYVAVEVTAATGTTFHIDGVTVYEGATPPAGGQLEGLGAGSALNGVRAEENTLTVPALTRTSDSDANGGFSMADSSVSTSGESYTVSFPVDPALSFPDDYSQGGVRIEVWARIMLSAAFTGGVTATLYAAPAGSGIATYAPEGGGAGLPVPLPDTGDDVWRVTRLGTLDLRRGDTEGLWRVVADFHVAAGTNAEAFAIDDIYVVPERSRFLLPTGKPRGGSGNDEYPDFIPFQEPNRAYRWVRSDLSSTIALDGTEGQAGGVSGSPIELPTGPIRILALASSEEPDDTTPHDFSDIQGFSSTHLAVRPRSHWLAEA